MYSLEGIKKGLRHPRFVGQELNRLRYRRLRTWPYNRAGIDVFDQDWDVLLLLDACRYDLFTSTCELPGETRAVTSRGSATLEFLRGNFDGRSLLDTVYVTASPMLSRHRDAIDVRFHDVVDVWADTGWDSEFKTVRPETVADEALRARREYPKKRLLVHFLQPHYPFLGPTGQAHFDLDSLSFQWEDVATGRVDVPDDVIWQAYEENLRLTVPSLERLFETLEGKLVLSSDHGQVIGERGFPVPIREYGHPRGIYADELVTVPWHVHTREPRPEIVAEAPRPETERDHSEGGLARERLEALGYV